MPLNDWPFLNNHPNKWLEDVHVQGEKEFYESKINPKEGVVPDSSQTKKSDTSSTSTKNDGKKSGIHKRKSTQGQQKSQQKKQGNQGKSSQTKQKKKKK